MTINKVELTDDELLVVLQYRKDQAERTELKKEKSFWRKYIFNKYAFFDCKQAVIRETTKLIFTVWVLEKYFGK